MSSLKLKFVMLLALASCMPIAVSANTAPLSIVVAATPGGASDILARLLSQKLQPILKRTVVVENKPGANAIVGATYVANAQADGTTLLLADKTTVALNPVLQKKLPYSAKALRAVADLARIDFFFAARKEAPYHTWAEMLSYAKRNPGRVSVATTGLGSGSHISLELMARKFDTSFINVPYKGMTQAVQAVMGGNTDAALSGPEGVVADQSSNRMQLLAVSSESRSKLAPNVPTLKELGYEDVLILPTGFTLYAPANTPDRMVDELNRAIGQALQDPEILSRMDGYGLTLDYQDVATSTLRMNEWGEKLSNIVADLKIKLD